MQISIARAIARSRDEVEIVKQHPFGRFLTSNYCKLSIDKIETKGDSRS